MYDAALEFRYSYMTVSFGIRMCRTVTSDTASAVLSTRAKSQMPRHDRGVENENVCGSWGVEL